MHEQDQSDNPTPLDDILADYFLRLDRGETVDREAFVAAHPAYADELRAFFNDSEAVDRMVLSAADELGGDLKAPPLSADIRYFGEYVLTEELGRGGMGVVYKARQESLGRTVAIKMILAGRLAHPRDVERFHREAETAAQLKHPNIVTIYEVGEHEGHHYFSMDYIEGQSLAERVRANPLSPRLAARYIMQVAKAVEYAHQQGTLHRDLKPSNILINTADLPVVVDFGLAKQCHGDSDATASGAKLGSPGYMAPEQAEGRVREISVRSDVYSLGATLYHLITGRPPFQADTASATLLQTINDRPAAPRLLNKSIVTWKPSV